MVEIEARRKTSISVSRSGACMEGGLVEVGHQVLLEGGLVEVRFRVLYNIQV